LTDHHRDTSAGEWLESLAAVGWRPGLERSRALMEALGSPQDGYRTIHVVGTNGKTSTTRYAEALLVAGGFRTGSLTSPHLFEWTERVRVDGRPVAADVWERALERTRTAVGQVEELLPEAGPVTQFEAATAAGFLALAESGVGFAVIEAGLGGRLDSTNVIGSEVTVLTSIGLDHTEWLGETEAEIAREKLAVLRSETVLVIGPLDPVIRDLSAETARGLECRLIEVGDPGDGPALPKARYARIDFALAVAAVGQLTGEPSVEDRLEALAVSGPRGRLELAGSNPTVILDVAHNAAGVAALAESIPEVIDEDRLLVVFGCLGDRDPVDLLAPLAGLAEKIFACRMPSSGGPAGREGLDPSAIVDAAAVTGIEAEAFVDPGEALSAAVAEAGREGAAVLVCGSHGLIGSLIGLQR
jgi:dihydrofolate synthase/folylpolyglutamate synthase